jgi:hypothetical protein
VQFHPKSILASFRPGMNRKARLFPTAQLFHRTLSPTFDGHMAIANISLLQLLVAAELMASEGPAPSPLRPGSASRYQCIIQGQVQQQIVVKISVDISILRNPFRNVVDGRS